MQQYDYPYDTSTDDARSEEGVVFKHSKDGLSIYVTIYNTNNNANQESQAGLKQKSETGGQISGHRGQNADQGGQIAENCGQNANQDGSVTSENCGRRTTIEDINADLNADVNSELNPDVNGNV